MTLDNDWTLRRAQGENDMTACVAIRHQVFVREQCVDEALERDGRDGDCIHYLALGADGPVGTGRVMPLEDRYKIQRVAMLPRARGTGLGAALMRFMMADLANEAEAARRTFFLSSQVHALPFYEKLGFSVCSGVYMDAGIPHRDMQAPVIPPARA